MRKRTEWTVYELRRRLATARLGEVRVLATLLRILIRREEMLLKRS